MELILNELSLEGQFNSHEQFHGALAEIIKIRGSARNCGVALLAHRNTLDRKVTIGASVRDSIGRLSREKRLSILLWLTRDGPFWDESRRHSMDDYLECEGQLVTDSGIGEAAHRVKEGGVAVLISLAPSSWQRTPLNVSVCDGDLNAAFASISNYWTTDGLLALIRQTPKILSWAQLRVYATERYQDLTFHPECFDHLNGHPFVPAASKQIDNLLNCLQRMVRSFTENGERTAEGHEIYQQHFTGEKAWFSDSSESEKSSFRTEMTFTFPGNEENAIFCPWHGKVKTPQIRIHFSWPIRYSEPLFVAYIGPKITKR